MIGKHNSEPKHTHVQANVVGKEGKVYGLDMHLDRLLRSAGLARIKPAFTKQARRSIFTLLGLLLKVSKEILIRTYVGPSAFD